MEDRLRESGSDQDGNKWRCPSCKRHSLLVSEGRKGLRVTCWLYGEKKRGCSLERILEELGGRMDSAESVLSGASGARMERPAGPRFIWTAAGPGAVPGQPRGMRQHGT